VRLLRVYNLLFYLLAEDTTDIRFDKSKDYQQILNCNYAQSIQCWDEDMIVKIVRSSQPDSHPGGDIIIIEDRGSSIKGEPFHFATSVENRRPMLDYITESYSESRIDFARGTDSSITFQPFAYDPDEDILRMEYRGWKQNGFESSVEYVDGINCNGQKNWCGSFNLMSIRPDVVRVDPTVYDETGLSDSQPVRIRVGEKADDVRTFCPERPDDFEIGSCNPALDSCTCIDGKYCVWNVPKPITCKEGSLCCQTIEGVQGSIATNKMTCEGAECYQYAERSQIKQTCTGNANCTQFVLNEQAIQNCGIGTHCWQETRSGKIEQTCTGLFCMQETNKGEIVTTCSSPLPNTQGDTLQICK